MKPSGDKNLLFLHFIVFIWGFTAILGKLISIPAVELTWYRMLIAALSLLGISLFKRKTFQINAKKTWSIILVGFIVALHWISFFQAIKISNISIALVCFSSCALFTAIIEPLFFKKQLSIVEIILGLFSIIGIYIIFQFEYQYFWGILFALLSALLASVFSVFNKKFIDEGQNSLVISTIEMFSGVAGISLYLLYKSQVGAINMNISFADLVYLLALGIICTAFAFWASVKIMETLSAYIISLTVNLEPIYGIILAFMIFGEDEKMTSGFYLGAMIVMLAVFSYPILKRKIIP